MTGKPFRPMLADAPEPGKFPLRFPFLASPKLDGIRCVITPAGPRTRALKEIPNRRLAERLNRRELWGLDGELIHGWPQAEGCIQATTSAVMSEDGDADGVTFWVFDSLDCFNAPSLPAVIRLRDAARVVKRYGAECGLAFVDHESIYSDSDLATYAATQMADGFEGAMLKDPRGRYKFGRSTAKEQLLLKVKGWEDAEGRVVDAYEQEANTNEQTRSELGLAKRSSAKAGKVGKGVLGGIVVELGDGWESETVSIGGGAWSHADRAALWQEHLAGRLVGRLAKYKFQRYGAKDAPRIPQFVAWRDPRDMG